MILVVAVNMAFIILKCILSILNLLHVYHEKMFNFVKCFFGIYQDDHMIVILQSVNVVYHIT